ncbi:response regulator [Tuberibacillus sp. Marseille-P3662]|uniref:response regulator n=1 Tax=Tuberibacillus sp. Marseille-P3662 TaxID=1965358 RepID=UPI000A1C8544|nr:response regulator transcription factor [Tuberibacillus sp. Marseille-P3662]
MCEAIKVMIVDDHDMVRKGLKAYLDIEETMTVVGEADSGNRAVAMAGEVYPDVILMDLIMENGDGITATKEILQSYPDCKIIILTSFYDDEQVFPALEAGATSYLLKTTSSEDIVEAIHKATMQDAVIDDKVASKMVNRMRHTQHQHDELTERELEVLKLVGKGRTNADIADELFIGIKTVKTHVSNVLHKLEVQDRTQAAVYAHEHDLV